MVSCEYEIIEYPEIEPPVEDVSFATQVLPIFINDCVSCHSAGNPTLSLTEANAYNDLFAKNLIDTANPEMSVLYEHIFQGTISSHPVKFNAEDGVLVLSWISQGAKNN